MNNGEKNLVAASSRALEKNFLPDYFFNISYFKFGLLFFFMLATGWLYRDTLQSSDIRQNRLGQILKPESHYYQSPIQAITGEVISLIQQTANGKCSFDIRVNSIIRENQEIPLSGRLKVFSFDLISFAQKNKDFAHLGQLAPGKELIIAKSPNPLAKRFAMEKNNPYTRYLAETGFDGTVYINRVTEIDLLPDQKTNQAQNILYWVEKGRNQIWLILQKNFSIQLAPVLQGLLVGDSSRIPQEYKKAFKESGALHLFAASGLHLTLLFTGIFTIFRRLPFISRYSQWFAFLTGIFYFFLTGFRISLFRAFLLALFPFIGRIGGRKITSRQSLALVIIVILAMNPKELFNAGFQMSILAVGGIIWLVPPLSKLVNAMWDSSGNDIRNSRGNFFQRFFGKILHHGINGLIVSFCATWSIAPVLWFSFQNFQPWSIFFNIIIIPLGSLLVLLGFLALPLLLIFPKIILIPLIGWIEGTGGLLISFTLVCAKIPEIIRHDFSLKFIFDLLFLLSLTLPLVSLWILKIRQRRVFATGLYQKIIYASAFERISGLIPLFLICLIPVFLGFSGRVSSALHKKEVQRENLPIHFQNSLYSMSPLPEKSKFRKYIFIGSAAEWYKNRQVIGPLDIWLIPALNKYYLKNFQLLLESYPKLTIVARQWRTTNYLLTTFLNDMEVSQNHQRFIKFSNKSKISDLLLLQKKGSGHLIMKKEPISLPKELSYFQGYWLYSMEQQAVRVWDMAKSKEITSFPQNKKIIWLASPRLLHHFTGPKKLIIYTGYESESVLQKYFGEKEICFAQSLLPLDFRSVREICFN